MLYNKELGSEKTYNGSIDATMSPAEKQWHIKYTYMAMNVETYVYSFTLKYR